MEPWLEEALRKVEAMPVQAREIRDLAMNDLFFFAKLVNPGYMYGAIHRELFGWLQEYTLYGKGDKQSANKLIQLPRAHLKSHILATFAAWLIVRHPEITILYVSATAELAETQLYAIKNILGSNIFSKYWPEYLNPEEGRRNKWAASKIIIDHIQRAKEGIRDATITTAGLTTNTTGWHADVVIADDLVVPENAYTEDGRDSVVKKASQFTSIRNAGGFTVAAGTRYHPADIYGVWDAQMVEIYADDGEKLGEEPVWEIKKYPVEEEGVFLWPSLVRPDGKVFGFNHQSLARIRAEYADRTQFYAQYYNDPNDPDSARMGREVFQYFNKKFLKREGSAWYYNGKRLNIYASVDFAYSLGQRADYTAIVVIGIDSDKHIYVLDIDRFKSKKSIEYFQHIMALQTIWQFRKILAEVTAAQITIVESIKDFIKAQGSSLSVIEYRPSRTEGSKEERIAAILEHRYENREIWHFEGGWTPTLEEELILSRPAHDDIKDALASAITIAVPPMRSAKDRLAGLLFKPQLVSRFGGI